MPLEAGRHIGAAGMAVVMHCYSAMCHRRQDNFLYDLSCPISKLASKTSLRKVANANQVVYDVRSSGRFIALAVLYGIIEV